MGMVFYFYRHVIMLIEKLKLKGFLFFFFAVQMLNFLCCVSDCCHVVLTETIKSHEKHDVFTIIY